MGTFGSENTFRAQPTTVSNGERGEGGLLRKQEKCSHTDVLVAQDHQLGAPNWQAVCMRAEGHVLAPGAGGAPPSGGGEAEQCFFTPTHCKCQEAFPCSVNGISSQPRSE